MPRLKGLGYGDIDLVLEKRTKDGRFASCSQIRDRTRNVILVYQSIWNQSIGVGWMKRKTSQPTYRPQWTPTITR